MVEIHNRITSPFLDSKLDRLAEIYDDFEAKASPLKAGQACEKGCAFCCESAGSIDITTLEGWQIQKQLDRLKKNRLTALTKQIRQDIRKRERKKPNPCPFLNKNKTCLIYDVRPFSCRRIYSVHVCDKTHAPRLNRQLMAMANTTLKTLQSLDDTGYSGHISFVLHMIQTRAFMQTYAAGNFYPAEIMAFGKSHGIIINKMMI